MTFSVLMTGATGGLGLEAAQRILHQCDDAHLIVLARSGGDRLPGALITGEAGVEPGRVSPIRADLSSLGSIRDATAEVARLVDSGAQPPLRTLVCNAGVQYTNDLTESADGHEATFAVNVLANHLIIRRLSEHLQRPARIVVTVSDTHFGDLRHNLGLVPGPKWKPPDLLASTGAFPNPGSTTAGRTAYSTSKLAAIYLVHEHAGRLGPGITVLSYNPGFVPGTGLARNADHASRFAMRRVLPVLARTPLASSPTAAGQWLADVALGAIDAPSGSYVDRAREAPSSTESYDPGREAELWDTLERLCGTQQA